MNQTMHGASAGVSGPSLLPMIVLEPFIPVPVVIELSPREGWAAFTAAMRDRDLKPQICEEARRDIGGERVRNLFDELFPGAHRGDGLPDIRNERAMDEKSTAV